MTKWPSAGIISYLALALACVGELVWAALAGAQPLLTTVCILILGVLAFLLVEFILPAKRDNARASRKQMLFQKPLAFEEQRLAFLLFIVTFIAAWIAVFVRIVPEKCTYDGVFGPVVVVGCWWFIHIFRNTRNNFGWKIAARLFEPFFALWLLANIVDLGLIKLGAWNFSPRTTVASIPLTGLLGRDVFGNSISVPVVEIFGFNLFIPWFILFVQIFIDYLIGHPVDWKRLFSIPAFAPSLDVGLLPPAPALDPKLDVSRAAAAYNLRALEEALDGLFQNLEKGLRLNQNDVKGILDALRKHRFFSQMQRVCDALHRHNLVFPVSYRQMAQAFIDQGHAQFAPFYLEQIQPGNPQSRDEWKEAQGLLGRTFKQCYVDMRKTDPRAERYLLSAIDHYRAVYVDGNANYWHGINYVACLARGQKDGLKAAEFALDWKYTAREILNSLSAKLGAGNDDPWALATCLEACVALGKPHEAEGWAKRYVECDNPKADLFEYLSTYRQLTEVWKLGEGKEYAKVLDLLRKCISRMPGGQAALRRQESPEPRDGVPIGKLSDAAKALARVEKRDGVPVGSGFLVSARAVWEGWGDKAVFITAEHVIGSGMALKPEEAQLHFFSTGQTCRPGKMLWSSPELDVAILEMPEKLPFSALSIFPTQGHEEDLEPNQSPIYVLGYPDGGQLQLSCMDSRYMGSTSLALRYMVRTRPGSSGGPVMDEECRAIGVHTGLHLTEDMQQGAHFAAIAAAIAKEMDTHAMLP